MEKLLYLFLIIGLTAVSCNKTADIPGMQDVVFKAIPATTSNLKESEPEKAAKCKNPVAHYAVIVIDGTTNMVDVFYLNGIIYTNTLKLAPGTHSLKSFTLINNGGTPGFTSELMDDDFIVQATPLINSEYEKLVKKPLSYDFEVDASFKLELNIEILCYVPNEHELFGFARVVDEGEIVFTVDEVIVRGVCFFGDICVDGFLDYEQSLYAQQKFGLRHDMPAIFKIEVWRTHNDISDSITSYSNEEWLGEGAPLCVQYPDFANVEDLIEFKLFILLKVGDGFEYVHYYTFTTMDGLPMENIGDDNVLDFALGTCVQNPDVMIPYDLSKMVVVTEDPCPAPLIGGETAFAFDPDGITHAEIGEEPEN